MDKYTLLRRYEKLQWDGTAYVPDTATDDGTVDIIEAVTREYASGYRGHPHYRMFLPGVPRERAQLIVDALNLKAHQDEAGRSEG